MPSKAQTIESLRGVELFRELNKAQLVKVARVADHVSVKAGRDIVRERSFRESGGASFFMILDGRVEISNRGRKVARLNPGDSFGELSLLDGKPRSATVRALTDMEMLRIRSWNFQRLLRSEPAIGVALLRHLAARLRAMDETQRRGR